MSDDQIVRLYSVAELARLWHVSKTFVYDEIKSGRLPMVQMGRGDRNMARVRATDAARWLDQRQPRPRK